MTAKRTSASGKKRILIIDDHSMTREGLRALISREADMVVCGEMETAAQALDAVTKVKSDLALVDITLRGKNGIELIKDLRAAEPALLILVISMHDESLYAERALRAGARGYIMKQETGSEMIQAMRRVLSGRIYVSEKMSTRILEVFSGGQPVASRSAIEDLTDREFEVFQLIGGGFPTHQIASRLHLSAKTVDAHRASIKSKLEIKTMPELISYAARWVVQQELTPQESKLDSQV